jgi:hypothetical protein
MSRQLNVACIDRGVFMIVWNGAGILVILVAVLGWAIGAGLGDDKHGMVGGGLGLLASATALWYGGRIMNSPVHDRILIDPKTGQQVVLTDRHTLFWIPMEWWAVIIGVGGLAVIINALINGD